MKSKKVKKEKKPKTLLEISEEVNNKFDKDNISLEEAIKKIEDKPTEDIKKFNEKIKKLF